MFRHRQRVTSLALLSYVIFFFNDTATTEIYTLSLHDALPICPLPCAPRGRPRRARGGTRRPTCRSRSARATRRRPSRSAACPDRKSTRLNSSHANISYAVFCLKKKEQTSELQSHQSLVYRHLL